MTRLSSERMLIVALYGSPGPPGCTNHDHLELVNFIAEKDSNNAVKAMNDHLKEIEDKLNLEETTDEISLEDVFNVS